MSICVVDVVFSCHCSRLRKRRRRIVADAAAVVVVLSSSYFLRFLSVCPWSLVIGLGSLSCWWGCKLIMRMSFVVDRLILFFVRVLCGWQLYLHVLWGSIEDQKQTIARAYHNTAFLRKSRQKEGGKRQRENVSGHNFFQWVSDSISRGRES